MALIKIHRYIEGPFEDGDELWYNLCLVEDEDGELQAAEVYFEDFDAAIDAKNALTTTLYIFQADADVCSTMTLN